MRLFLASAALALAAQAALAQTPAATPPAVAPSATASEWRTIDPENALVIDTTQGRVIVELAPFAAPVHVARIKELAREGFYDGLVFHRVIDKFMAQTGDPTGTGEGDSPKTYLAGEFMFLRGPDLPFVPVVAEAGGQIGFVGSMPVATQSDDIMVMRADGKAPAFGLYCPGTAGMARTSDPNSANSQFFLMRAANASLESKYTPWGRVVSGLDVVRKLKVGEPPADPDKMVRVRVLADLPANERPTLQALDARSATFRAAAERAKAEKKDAFDPCELEIPVRVTPPA